MRAAGSHRDGHARSVLGEQLRVDPMAAGLPLLTTKKVHLRSNVNELLWCIHGETHELDQQERGVTIWDEWATPRADRWLPRPRCGRTWAPSTVTRGAIGATRMPDGSYARDGVDQLGNVVAEIRRNPVRRRLIEERLAPGRGRPGGPAALATRSSSSTWTTGSSKRQLYQRSADVFLGVPFNIASYALLTTMIAQVAGLGCADFAHDREGFLCNNDMVQAAPQLSRKAAPAAHAAPRPGHHAR